MTLPFIYHPDYVTPLPEGHRFPMPKFGEVQRILLSEGIVGPEQFYVPEIASRDMLQLVHSPQYVDAFCDGTLDRQAERRIGLPWSNGLVKRTRTAVGGTVLTVKLALEHGIACNTAGGTHHAFPEYGSGFCIFNDIAIAAQYARSAGLAKRVLIVDLDVHQGDATAFIFADEPDVFTFSMHCGVNFPFRKQKSDLDVDLPVGMNDDAYLVALENHLPDLLSTFNPDLVIYDAGVDPHKDDSLGKLALSNEGLYRRDAIVVGRCLANGFPIATVIGGGYDKDIVALAHRHTMVHRAATDLVRRLHS
ncbi:MAG: histone deacetylase family protein [Calditrichia bacterium]